jgi:hypothetical protein
VKLEHCLPALKHLKSLPAGKDHIIKIENVPRRATDENLKKYLNKKIPGFKYKVLGIENKNKRSQNDGVAYIKTDDVHSAS